MCRWLTNLGQKAEADLSVCSAVSSPKRGGECSTILKHEDAITEPFVPVSKAKSAIENQLFARSHFAEILV